MIAEAIQFLSNPTVKTVAATVASIVGIVGAAWKWLPSKPKLKTLFHLSGPDEGNTITVINTSDKPVQVAYWRLVWRKPVNIFKVIDTVECDADFDGGVFRIDGHNSRALHFRDDRYFQWGQHQAAKGLLYLEIWLVDRKIPIKLMVYDPSAD